MRPIQLITVHLCNGSERRYLRFPSNDGSAGLWNLYEATKSGFDVVRITFKKL